MATKTKTTPLNDNTHMRLKELQILILKEYHKHKSISEIVADVLGMIKDNGELVRNIMEPNRHRVSDRHIVSDRHGENVSGENVNTGVIAGGNVSSDGVMPGDKHSNILKPPGILLVKEEDMNT